MTNGQLPLYPTDPGRRSGSNSSTGLIAFGLKRLITVLAAVALLLGIAAEGISILSGYYNMQKTSYEATSERMKALGASCNYAYPPPGGCPRP